MQSLRILPVKLLSTGRQVVSASIAISHLQNVREPLAEGQRKLAVEQVKQAYLSAAAFFAGFGFYKILRSARDFAAVGLAYAWKPRLVPGLGGVMQRLVAFVADYSRGVERLVKGFDSIDVG